MKYYIFLTKNGDTITPIGEEIETLQVLDWTKGKTKKDAFRTFLKNNAYFKEHDFKDIMAMELKNESVEHFEM